MTLERKYHIAAITLLVAAIVAGAVSFTLDGAAFWALCGIALVLVIAGMYVAARAGAEHSKRLQR